VPPGAPGFYQALPAWTNARWIGPAMGYVDPVKEILATVKALEWGLTTYADAAAEQGGAWEEVFAQRSRENAAAREMGLALGPAAAPAAPVAASADVGNEDEGKDGGDENEKEKEHA